MPSRCIILGCRNTSRKGVSLHQLPRDPIARLQWTEFVAKTSYRYVTKCSKICSVHFKDSDFVNKIMVDFGLTRALRLRQGAVPSKFCGSSRCEHHDRLNDVYAFEPTPESVARRLFFDEINDSQRHVTLQDTFVKAEPEARKSAPQQDSSLESMIRNVAEQTVKKQELTSRTSPVEVAPKTAEVSTSPRLQMFARYPEYLENKEDESTDDSDQDSSANESSDDSDQENSTDESSDDTDRENDINPSSRAVALLDQPRNIQPLNVQRDPRMISNGSLLEMFSKCPECTNSCSMTQYSHSTFVTVKQDCGHCSHSKRWTCQPLVTVVPGGTPLSPKMYFSWAIYASAD